MMGRWTIRWLLHDDQKEVFEIVFAIALSLVFLALLTLLLWPLGKGPLAWRLAQGYALLWGCTFFLGSVINQVSEWLHIDMDSNFDAYVLAGVAVCVLLQLGWSAFATLTLQDFLPGSPLWIAVMLYLVVGLSCLIAFYVIGSFYQGSLYRLATVVVALISFILFAIWPEGGRLLFGWFFELLG